MVKEKHLFELAMVIVILTICSVNVFAQTKWEYMSVEGPIDAGNDWLNKKGADGWELVSAIPYKYDVSDSSTKTCVYIFKRPIGGAIAQAGSDESLDILSQVNMLLHNILFIITKQMMQQSPLSGKQPPPTYINPQDDSEMLLIPEGWFIMGGNDGLDDEKPQHIVWVDAFYIDKYEVTNAQYAKFLNAKKKHEDSEGHKYLDLSSQYCKIELSDGTYTPKSGHENHPVATISWYGAKDYAVWAGKRLPTEAEWEKTARGTDGRTWPWGNQWVSAKCNSKEVNDGYTQTAPVGSFPGGVSPYGVFDMAGNVWEWVQDWYGDYQDQTPPLKNPKGVN